MAGIRHWASQLGIGAAPASPIVPAVKEPPHIRLSRYWLETRDPHEDPKSSFRSPVSHPPPADAEAKVQALEAKYDLRLPSDFREYLIHAAPSDENWDVAGHHWWPIDRIRTVPDELDHEVAEPTIARQAASCLFFGDYLIWCNAWAIVCGDGADRGKIVRIGGSGEGIIAADFAAFIDRYIADPWGVA